MQQRYDSQIQMFIEQPKPVDTEHLRFLRWLGERGKLEHPVVGAPSGELAVTHEEVAA